LHEVLMGLSSALSGQDGGEQCACNVGYVSDR
jgi:hypothetical protein